MHAVSLFLPLLCISVAPRDQEAHAAHVPRRIVSADSAVINSPPYRTVLHGPVADYAVTPRCSVACADLYVTRYPAVTETLARKAVHPFNARWDISATADQDQFSLYFGYTLYHVNGDTIVAPPLTNRWCIVRRTTQPSQRISCRELPPRRVIDIDGDAKDWKGIRRHTICAGAVYACTWNAAAFYLLVDVDDSVVTSGDRVEACFDLYHTRAPFADSLHRIIFFSPAGRSFALATALDAHGPRRMDSVIVRIGDEMQWRPSHRPGGYRIEARIPFCVLSDHVFPPSRFGFGVSVVDEDAAAGVEKVFSWPAAEAACRRSPVRWGIVILRQTMAWLKATLLFLCGVVVAIVTGVGAAAGIRKYHDINVRRQDRLPRSPAAQALCDCIESRYAEPGFSLAGAARATGESVERLEAALHSELGADFDNLLALVRIRAARRLLDTTCLPPEEISRRCGFSTYKEFELSFTRIAGVTPEVFRMRRAEEKDEAEESG